jgi:hypothetical protein
LYESATGALSNGAGSHFFVGATGDGLTRRALITFDVAAAIPAGSTVNSASLTLRMTQTSNTTGTNVSLHRALADWGEGTSRASGNEGGGAAATPGDATWIHRFFPTSGWVSAGGDFDIDESAHTLVSSFGAYTWSGASMVRDLQHWLDVPSENYGWMLRGDEGGSSTAKRFDSRSVATVLNRPVLTIDYTPVPEPTTTLFVCGAPALVIGRFTRALHRSRAFGAAGT